MRLSFISLPYLKELLYCLSSVLFTLLMEALDIKCLYKRFPHNYGIAAIKVAVADIKYLVWISFSRRFRSQKNVLA